jgi:hypothetical protein
MKFKVGDLVHIVRYHLKIRMNALTGIVLNIRTVEPIHETAGEAFIIQLLETQGNITDYFLNHRDTVKVLCAAG